MPTYLVESYAANRPDRIDDACERARLAADLASNVSYLRTMVVPGDEVVLHLFEAESADALRAAVSSAGLEHERIIEAIEPPAVGPQSRSDRATSPDFARRPPP